VIIRTDFLSNELLADCFSFLLGFAEHLRMAPFCYFPANHHPKEKPEDFISKEW